MRDGIIFYGKNWKHAENENNNIRQILNIDNKLYALKYDQFIYVLNEENEWVKVFDKNLGFTACIVPFCCESFFASSNKNYLVFNKDQYIEFPKFPNQKKFDFFQAAYITPKFVVVSVLDYGLWYIPIKFTIDFGT